MKYDTPGTITSATQNTTFFPTFATPALSLKRTGAYLVLRNRPIKTCKDKKKKKKVANNIQTTGMHEFIIATRQ